MKKLVAFSSVLLVLYGCAGVGMPTVAHQRKPEEVKKPKEILSCLQEKYDNSGLVLEVGKVYWKDKIIKFEMENLPMGSIPHEQRKLLEEQNTAFPQDRYLIFDIAIKNTNKAPLMWLPTKPPIFSLIDEGGIKYASIGQAGGNMKDISAIIMLGQQSNINPNRSLKGTQIFDVPATGKYQLLVSLGKWAGGFGFYADQEIMRCKVDVPE